MENQTMTQTITIEVTDLTRVSDGYHTFQELYDHRNHLFMALMKSFPDLSWKSKKHHDGSGYEGWFIAGIHLPTGDITYHLPEWLWVHCPAKELEFAPEWDGHTSKDVLKRLGGYVICP